MQQPTRIFYRIIRGTAATRDDFRSYAALGRALRDDSAEGREDYTGVSVFATEQQARAKARLPLFRGYRGIAVLQVPETVQAKRTESGRGHHTIWGEPDELLQYVVAVVPL